MITKISFVKDSTSKIKTEFCEIQTLRKQYKVYSKKLPIKIIDKSGDRIHIDLFDGRNILPSIGDY